LKTFAALALAAMSQLAAAEPLIYDSGRIFVRAAIKDVATEALLDSGAESSVVDPVLAKRAKLPPGLEADVKGSGGEAGARIVYGVTISAGGITVKDQLVVITDLAEVSKRLIKRPTELILGRELFDAAVVRVDIQGRVWGPLPPGAQPVGTRLALTKHAGIEAVPVTVNGVPAHADLDLGNGSKVLVSKAMAAQLGLKVVGQESGGGIGGKLTRDLVRLDRLELAGRTFRDVDAAVDPLDNAGELNIGTAILEHFIVTTDFKGRAVYLAPAARP
jgi:predicted aspartyl protease